MKAVIFRKCLAVGVITIFAMASLSPVYAGITFSESKAMESKIAETTTIENRNLLDRESFLDRCDSSELEEHPYFNHRYRHDPIRKPTVIDGVNGSWNIVVPDDYPTIQEAVDYTTENYPNQPFRILVKSGTYYENVQINTSMITLHGEDRENTIIDGGNKYDVIRVTSNADGVNISGFTIQNSGGDHVGFNISSHYNTVEDNIIKNNDKGISLFYSSGNQIQNNDIMKNEGDGIWLHRSNADSILDNTISENGDNGIEFTYSSLGTTIEDNSISDNANCGILLTGSSLGNSVIGNSITINDFGVKCIGVSDGNTFYHNMFIGNSKNAYDSSMDLWDHKGIGNYWDDYTGVDDDGDGIGDTPYIIPGGANQDCFPLMDTTLKVADRLVQKEKGNTSNFSNSLDSTSYMAMILENDDWDIIVPDDYPTIQEAINHSESGFRVFVKGGVYIENVNIAVPNLTLHGEDRDTVIIDGGNAGNVVAISAPDVEVSGFTIRRAASGFHGVFVKKNSVIVHDNLIELCTYGISLFGCCNDTITGNLLTRNYYSGIMVWKSVGNLIADNIVEENDGDGLVLTMESSAEIVRNRIVSNGFNGMLLMGCTNATIENNTVELNGMVGGSWFGIQMFHGDDNLVLRNTIKNNSNDGISLHGSTCNIIRENLVRDNIHGMGISLWFHSDGNHIDENDIRSNWDNGITLYDDSNNNFISNNTVCSNDWFGILGGYCRYSIITENIICSNIREGMVFLWCKNNIITGNTVTSNGYDRFALGGGINLFYDGRDNIICNNIVRNNSMDGIALGYSCVYNTIIENTIDKNGYGSILGGFGLIVEYDCSNNLFANNTILNNRGDGIMLGVNCKNNRIFGNTIQLNGYGKIILWLPGTGIELIGTCSNNTISRNNILQNFYGVEISLSSNDNTITQNNFIHNLQQAGFLNSFNNSWNGNYWKYWPPSIPRPIFGYILGLTVLNFDWHPAQEPYDIP